MASCDNFTNIQYFADIPYIKLLCGMLIRSSMLKSALSAAILTCGKGRGETTCLAGTDHWSCDLEPSQFLVFLDLYGFQPNFSNVSSELCHSVWVGSCSVKQTQSLKMWNKLQNISEPYFCQGMNKIIFGFVN